MTRTRILAVGVIVLISASEVQGVRQPDRTAALTALDQRALTGIPRALDHDEGEELQEAVTAALAANPPDPDMAWAVLRASFPIVPRVSPVIFDSMPSIDLDVLPPFAMPWKITAGASIEASLDGSDWRHAMDLTCAVGQTHLPIEKLFPRASRPGLHAVRLRATLRFAGGPGFLATRETRELPVITYGVTGPSAAGQRVAVLLNRAARVNASELNGALPHVGLGTWLRTVAATSDTPVFWTGAWCEDRTALDNERPSSICARAVLGSSPEGGHAEVWVKIATVDTSGPKPTWTEVTPTLEGVDLLAGTVLATGDLATLPSVLRSTFDQWPAAALLVNPRAMEISPANPTPGEPVSVAIEVRNTGTSDLFGAWIDVLVADDVNGPALAHRRFVRSIAAGESVTVKTDVRLPRAYGLVEAMILPGLSSETLVPMMHDGSNFGRLAWRIIRPELAPPAFVDRAHGAIGCQPDCGK